MYKFDDRPAPYIYDNVEKFIETNIDKLERLDPAVFVAGYEAFENSPVLTGQFTEVMLRCDVDPAEIIQSIPINYLFSCGNIVEYEIPTSIKVIPETAFTQCVSLTQILIPEGVTDIYNNCFAKCVGLKEVTLPSSVEFIGYFAFDQCRQLQTVKYLGTIDQWQNITRGDHIFNRCYKLEHIQCIDGIIDIKEYI